MKTATAIVLSFVLTACSPPTDWAAGPNPLDTPETFVSPPASMGNFGPHSQFYR